MDPIFSDFANDPDMADLLEFFGDQLGQHLQRIQDALSERDATALSTIAHQLKGSGAGYGFEPITATAAVVEDALRGGVGIEGVSDQVSALIQTCERSLASLAQHG